MARAYGEGLGDLEYMIGLYERGKLDDPNAYRGRYAVVAAILHRQVRPAPTLGELLSMVERGEVDGGE